MIRTVLLALAAVVAGVLVGWMILVVLLAKVIGTEYRRRHPPRRLDYAEAA